MEDVQNGVNLRKSQGRKAALKSIGYCRIYFTF